MAGQYEQLAGRAYGELDPQDPLNSIIQDINLGKDKDGNAVKFVSATVVLDTSRIVEIWAAVYGEGNNDGDVAGNVLDSLKLTPAQPSGAN
jgi:hypothetical protein